MANHIGTVKQEQPVFALPVAFLEIKSSGGIIRLIVIKNDGIFLQHVFSKDEIIAEHGEGCIDLGMTTQQNLSLAISMAYSRLTESISHHFIINYQCVTLLGNKELSIVILADNETQAAETFQRSLGDPNKIKIISITEIKK
jgi:hypothetical protein